MKGTNYTGRNPKYRKAGGRCDMTQKEERGLDACAWVIKVQKHWSEGWGRKGMEEM